MENAKVPQAPPASRQDGNPAKNWQAITSLVLVIVSIVSPFIPFVGVAFIVPGAIIGLGLGISGLKSAKRGLAITGIVLSAIVLLLAILVAIGFVLLARSPDFSFV